MNRETISTFRKTPFGPSDGLELIVQALGEPLLELRLQQIWRYVRGIKRIGIIITIRRSETGEGTLHTVTLAGQELTGACVVHRIIMQQAIVDPRRACTNSRGRPA